MSDTGVATIVISDVVTGILILAGGMLCLAAGVGLIRFPDVLTRLHAATKPQIFGLMVILLDVAINNFTIGTVTLVVAVIVFQSLTAPMSGHMVARIGYDTGRVRRDTLLVDDLKQWRGRRI